MEMERCPGVDVELLFVVISTTNIQLQSAADLSDRDHWL